MMYAIQGQNVRWFFSESEVDHLFNGYDFRLVNPAIKVKGNWNSGLVFRPVITRSSSGNDHSHIGNFPLEEVNNDIMCICTPRDTIKLAPAALKTVLQTGEIVCDTTRSRTLVVYPSEIISGDEIVANVNEHSETEHNEQSAMSVEDAQNTEDTENTPPENPEELQNEPSEQPMTESTTESTVDLAHTMSESPQPYVSEVSEETQTQTIVENIPKKDDLDWIRLIIDDINRSLVNHPNLHVLVTPDGKSVKLMRAVVQRRPI